MSIVGNFLFSATLVISFRFCFIILHARPVDGNFHNSPQAALSVGSQCIPRKAEIYSSKQNLAD